MAEPVIHSPACWAPGPASHPTEEQILAATRDVKTGTAYMLRREALITAHVCMLEEGHDGPHDWEAPDAR